MADHPNICDFPAEEGPTGSASSGGTAHIADFLAPVVLDPFLATFDLILRVRKLD